MCLQELEQTGPAMVRRICCSDVFGRSPFYWSYCAKTRAHDPGVNFHAVVDCYPSFEDPEIDQTGRVAGYSYPARQLDASVSDDHGLVAFHVLVGCCTFFVDRVAEPS